MIDLYSEDSVINHYADRYHNYMPVNVHKVIRSPQEWKNKLVQHERIAKMAGELFDRAPEDTFL